MDDTLNAMIDLAPRTIKPILKRTDCIIEESDRTLLVLSFTASPTDAQWDAIVKVARRVNIDIEEAE